MGAMTDAVRFPIGRFTRPERITKADIAGWIEEIAEAPAALRKAVSGLSEEQIDIPYREGGWTIRQVVHHLTDAHMNSYIRYKVALTEAEPTIKVWSEPDWAELPEAKSTPVEVSLLLLEALHNRWVRTLRSMKSTEFDRAFRHPENGFLRLDMVTAIYAWHGRHHTAQITGLRERMGW